MHLPGDVSPREKPIPSAFANPSQSAPSAATIAIATTILALLGASLAYAYQSGMLSYVISLLQTISLSAAITAIATTTAVVGLITLGIVTYQYLKEEGQVSDDSTQPSSSYSSFSKKDEEAGGSVMQRKDSLGGTSQSSSYSTTSSKASIQNPHKELGEEFHPENDDDQDDEDVSSISSLSPEDHTNSFASFMQNINISPIPFLKAKGKERKADSSPFQSYLDNSLELSPTSPRLSAVITDGSSPTAGDRVADHSFMSLSNVAPPDSSGGSSQKDGSGQEAEKSKSKSSDAGGSSSSQPSQMDTRLRGVIEAYRKELNIAPLSGYEALIVSGMDFENQAVEQNTTQSRQFYLTTEDVTKIKKLIGDPQHAYKQQKYENQLQQYQVLLEKGCRGAEELFGYLEINLINEDEESASLLTQEIKVLWFQILDILFPAKPHKDPRESAVCFVDLLRELSLKFSEISQKQNGWEKKFPTSSLAKIYEATQRLLIARWKDTELYSYQEECIELFLGDRLELSLDMSTLANKLLELNQYIKVEHPELKKAQLILIAQKVKGTVNLQDYTRQENVPHVRDRFVFSNGGKTQEIAFVRHGCPTKALSLKDVAVNLLQNCLTRGMNILYKAMQPIIGSSSSSSSNSPVPLHVEPSQIPEVAEDYEAFLRAMEALGKSVLYANYQRLNDSKPGAFDVEESRVKALQKLEEMHPNFLFLCHCLEGDFFEKKPTSINEGIGRVLEQFKQHDENGVSTSSLRMPKRFMNDARYMGHIQEMLEFVQKTFFPRKESFADVHEWQNFLIAFYILQRVDLRFWDEERPVEMVTGACKDFLDRGGLMALCEETLMLYKIGQEKNKNYLKQIAINTLSPPILVKKQEMIGHRLKEGAHFVNWIRDLFARDAGVLEAWRNYRFGPQNSWNLSSWECKYTYKETGDLEDDVPFIIVGKENEDPH